MAGIRLGWWTRVGLAACAVGLLAVNWDARRVPTPTESTAGPLVVAETPGPAGEPLLVNEGWHIRNMATAHGAFVIEVEAEDVARTAAIARALIEPIRDDYDEILVYVSDVTNDTDLPARRIQWTPAGGYIEIAYDQTGPDR